MSVALKLEDINPLGIVSPVAKVAKALGSPPESVARYIGSLSAT
jgi:hypothetical protein